MKKLLSSIISAAVLGTAVLSPVCSAEGNLYYAGNSSDDSVGGFETLFFETIYIKANYADGAYNYGTFLDENNVQVYMEMMKLINPSTETVSVKLPVPIKFTVSTPDSSKMTDEDILVYSNALFENCRPGIDAALFDIPELFWIDLGRMGVNITGYDISYNFRDRNYTI